MKLVRNEGLAQYEDVACPWWREERKEVALQTAMVSKEVEWEQLYIYSTNKRWENKDRISKD